MSSAPRCDRRSAERAPATARPSKPAVRLTGAVDPQRYLDRLGVPGPNGPPSVAELARLQVAHLVAVPFENIDVYHRRGVRTDTAWSLPKLVDRRRGGWCFELNGAFAWLLRELGYRVDHVACRVGGEEGWGAPFDHLALVVHLDGERWLVDVGFGDCCVEPIRLADSEVDHVPRPVRCRLDDGDFVIVERQDDGAWADQLRGTFEPRDLCDFDARSRYLQTEPGLSWTEKPFATRALDATGSRLTLRGGVLRTRSGRGEYVDRPVDPEEWPSLLAEHFGLEDTLKAAPRSGDPVQPTS
jgi:N-hydroxyarylamine O-acetyltransferase